MGDGSGKPGGGDKPPGQVVFQGDSAFSDAQKFMAHEKAKGFDVEALVVVAVYKED